MPRKTVPTSIKAPSTSDASGAAAATAPTRRTARTKEPTRRAAHPRSAEGAHDEASDEHEVVEAEPVEAGDEDREGHDDGDLDDAVLAEVAVEGDESLDGAVAMPPLPAAERGERSLGAYDPLSAYLSEVQRHTLLTPQEEHDLAVRYAKTANVEAAARMVTANLRLVVKIAYEYRRAYRNLMDLIQEGNIGLMQAVKRYDPYRGVKLSSYAAWWIRAYILRFILNNWRLVKLGTTQTQRKLFFNLNKEKQRLVSLGIDPTSAELAVRLDVPEQEVIDMDRRLSGSDVSLDAPVGENDGKPTSRVELLPSADAAVDDNLSDSQLGGMVRQHLDRFAETLTGKDVIIFRERITADEPVTLQEIGDRYGISRERVRQLEKRLQDKLRVYLTAELGDAIEFG